MSAGKKLLDGGSFNRFLTAYLYGLHALRGGRLSSGDAMQHVVDLATTMQRVKGSVTSLGGLRDRFDRES